MSGSILPAAKNSSRCLVQKGQKRCGKILKGKFAPNKEIKKKDVTAEKPKGANSTRTGTNSQAPSSQLQETIESTINPPR